MHQYIVADHSLGCVGKADLSRGPAEVHGSIKVPRSSSTSTTRPGNPRHIRCCLWPQLELWPRGLPSHLQPQVTTRNHVSDHRVRCRELAAFLAGGRVCVRVRALRPVPRSESWSRSRQLAHWRVRRWSGHARCQPRIRCKPASTTMARSRSRHASMTLVESPVEFDQVATRYWFITACIEYQRTNTIVAPQGIADGDDHDWFALLARHERSTVRSRKWVAQLMQGSWFRMVHLGLSTQGFVVEVEVLFHEVPQGRAQWCLDSEKSGARSPRRRSGLVLNLVSVIQQATRRFGNSVPDSGSGFIPTAGESGCS